MKIVSLQRLERFLDKCKSLFIKSGDAAVVKSLEVTGGSPNSVMRGDGSSVSYYADILSLIGLYCIDQNVSGGHNDLSVSEVTSDNVAGVVQDLLTALRSAGVLTSRS